jgi:signal peptidase I
MAVDRSVESPINPLNPEAITRLLLQEGREVLLSTVGFSMGYSIRSGEGVVIKAVPENRVRFGDVIVFEREEQLVCHRVVGSTTGARGRLFLTKGDPLVGFDEKVASGDVLGKVVRVKWREGDFHMETPRGRALNVSLALLSLGVGLHYRLFPIKEMLNRSNPGWAERVWYGFLALPSRAARKHVKRSS